MAGYIFCINASKYKEKAKEMIKIENPYDFSLDDYQAYLALKDIARKGIYSTRLNFNNEKIEKGTGLWNTSQEGTLGDYITMKENDNIYFFSKRKIYGIGSLVSLYKDECKFKNFKYAHEYGDQTKYKRKDILIEYDDYLNYRFLCSFKPFPDFFIRGLDMDEVLSFKPESYKMLRAMWKVSFIKIDDEENIALRNHILKKNEMNVNNKTNIFEYDKKYHQQLMNKIVKTPDNYLINILDFVNQFKFGNYIKHEMIIEDMVLEYIMKENNKKGVFGKIDFITHQFIASPFKPIDYMDKMDIFGYRYIEGFDGAISSFIVGEIKKDIATSDDLLQLMKYVDWISKEYTYGDYSMIEGYLIARSFDFDLESELNKIYRAYTIGTRPVLNCKWQNVKIINYLDIYNELNE